MVANRWDDAQAAACQTLLEQRVYSSRLLGQDAALVMHGGGNTSAKGRVKNLLGVEEDVLFIKGSGWDLATIQSPGFPAVRLTPLLALRQLAALTDEQMMNELRTRLLNASAPDPSVEALLHGFLPHRFVDHTHADAILALTNQPDGERRVRELFGARLAIVPYVMPGFQLAKLCADIFEQDPRVEGLVLLKHGLFTFGDTAKESYDRMIKFVNEAETALAAGARARPVAAIAPATPPAPETALGAVRAELLRRGFPCILRLDDSPAAQAFVARADCPGISARGPLTPDHVIRTKRIPLYVRDLAALPAALDAFAADYDAYFQKNRALRHAQVQRLDPFPRVFLVPGAGVITAGATAKDAAIARDLYAHTLAVITTAENMSGYEALPEADIFDMEYWSLEQAKLKLGPKRAALSGKIAVVTGAARGIGLAIAHELSAQGAVVHGFDLAAPGGTPPFHPHQADVSRREDIARAFAETVRASGGVDIVVVNAGIFPPSQTVDELDPAAWDKSLRINLDGAFHTAAEATKWLKRQGAGGDIVFIASKNVPAPGKAAAAYSVAKAGETQLARVLALEAGPHGIRVNLLHPHLIFDTAFWSDEKIAERAKAYGMTPDQYRRNNLLGVPLDSRDVARAVFALVAGYFSKTTGAQICVDGGSERTL